MSKTPFFLFFVLSFLLSSFKEELGDLGQRGTQLRQSSALGAVLSSFCSAHRSLLYHILKLACQEKKTESHCSYCGVNQHDILTPNAVPFSECKAHNSNLFNPSIDSDHQGLGSTMYHPGDSKSKCSIHQFSLTHCKSDTPLGSSYSCVQRCRRETYTAMCPKRLHCISGQSLAVGHINNLVCSFPSSPSLSKSPSVCTPSSSLCPSSSICCNQHKPHSCPCYSNHACLTQVRNSLENGMGDGDPPCPVLKREQSPSPPPLSPIPSDMDKKTDEKPPSLLHHRQEKETDLIVKDGMANESQHEAGVDTATEMERHCSTPRSIQSEQNPSGTSLQDVVNRFSEKLETIRPIEKDIPLVFTAVNVSTKEQPQCPSTSQNLQFQADAHLTEIITTVLHTGSASDYNLSELFNRHDSKEPKSPNTRLRRRQEVLAAIATPADDASTRRQTLQIKRELAMFDRSYSRKRMPQAKRQRLNDGNVAANKLHTLSDSNLVKEDSKKEMELDVEPTENHSLREGPLNILIAKSDNEVKEEIKAYIVAEKVQIIKAEEKVREISCGEKDLTLSGTIPTPVLQSTFDKRGLKGDSVQTKKMAMTATSSKQCSTPDRMVAGNEMNSDNEAHSGQSTDYDNRRGKDSRRSRRHIVPPQRYSSYVTEPRKMFYVSCFSENPFNQETEIDNVLTSSPVGALAKDPDAEDSKLESRSEAPLSSFQSTVRDERKTSFKESKGFSTNQVTPLVNVAAKAKSPTKQILDNGTDGSNSDNKLFRRLRSSPKRIQYSKTASSALGNPSNMDVPMKSSTCVESTPNSQFQYTSPIKLMFVSPVKDKEGVRYSLKSASSGCSEQEPFDPCIESSWSGSKSQTTKLSTSPVKSLSSPLKSATSPAKSTSSTPRSGPSPAKSSSSPAKSASSPAKSASSPAKSASSPPKSASSPAKSTSSPKSASSSPKTGSRRSGEVTPSKHVDVTESQRSPGDSISFFETTPKRRPGRPKKLGPQLEQKAKRPIGRPRKEKAVDSVVGEKTVNGKSIITYDTEENVNKNLKITVVFGRSRRNKRTVAEGFDQLQTEFHDACQAVGLKSDLSILVHSSKTNSGSIEKASSELSDELSFVSPLKESAPQSSSTIKCQKRDDFAPSRKPGRPAKVKISGISVTVTTVSPRQRKIQINKDNRQSPETLIPKKVLLPEFKSANEPRTISRQSSSKSSESEEGIETQDENKDKLPKQPVALRHSMRVRKPSIHFLHAVATSTSRSYSHSNALLRRSKQLLLNKASNERRQGEQPSSVEILRERRRPCEQEKNNVSQDLGRVAGVSVDSIFSPRETLRWWTPSAEEKTMSQELARRIRVISDTWVSNNGENQEKETAFKSKLGTKGKSSFTRRSKHSSVVRTLFDCPPDEPRSCSMQQVCSWFMKTTETKSLSIVKKASSRNSYELMHFPRSTNKESVCPSPQAQRLHKHIKKFAKTVPKSPLQHQQAQRSLRKRNEKIRRQLFASGRRNQETRWWRSRSFGKYQTTLLRAKTMFLTRKERERWRTKQRNKKTIKVATSSNGHIVTGPKRKALRRSARDQLSDCLENSNQTQEPADVLKEHNICSKAWSPETLKECRVFLRKINSPDNESAEEEWDSCTVTLDDGSPSSYLLAGRKRELVGVVKAVKTERERSTISKEQAGSAPKSVQVQDDVPVRRRNGKYKRSLVTSTDPPPPPPAKMLRQSRVRGLSGPRWCDFVFEN